MILYILGMNLSVRSKAYRNVSNLVLDLRVCPGVLCLMSRRTLVYWLSQCLSGKWHRSQLESFQQELKECLRSMGLGQVCGESGAERLARMCDAETHCVSGCILSNRSPPPHGSGKFTSALEFDTICQAMELAA